MPKFPERQIQRQFLVDYHADALRPSSAEDLDRMVQQAICTSLGALSEHLDFERTLVNQQFQVKVLEKTPTVDEDVTDNLVALVFRLVRALRKGKPNAVLEKQALDYLERQGYKVNSHQRSEELIDEGQHAKIKPVRAVSVRVSGVGRTDMSPGENYYSQADIDTLILERAELQKQLITAVAEWKKWEKQAGDNWCGYVERLAATEALCQKYREALEDIACGKFPKEGDEYADDSMVQVAIKALAPLSPQSALNSCEVNPVSSRCCELGTRGCTTSRCTTYCS